ncbi:MAG: VOC family protein [Dehalococcoidales bacterium]|nr:VOC family protein [Dehalococcoidales bacterium]
MTHDIAIGVEVDFLKNKGEGVHHVAFTVDDLAAETAKLAAKGIPCITRVKRSTGGAFAYFDFTRVGNVIIELIQLAKPK